MTAWAQVRQSNDSAVPGSAVARLQPLKLLHPLPRVDNRVSNRLRVPRPAALARCAHRTLQPVLAVVSQLLQVLQALECLLDGCLVEACRRLEGLILLDDTDRRLPGRVGLEDKVLLDLEVGALLRLGQGNEAHLVCLLELSGVLIWLDRRDWLGRKPDLYDVCHLLARRPTLQEINNPNVVSDPPPPLPDYVGLPPKRPRGKLWPVLVRLDLLGEGPYDQRIVAQAAGLEELDVELDSRHDLIPVVKLELELLGPRSRLSRLVPLPPKRQYPHAVTKRLRHKPVQHKPPLVHLGDADPSVPYHFIVAAPLQIPQLLHCPHWGHAVVHDDIVHPILVPRKVVEEPRQQARRDAVENMPAVGGTVLVQGCPVILGQLLHQ
mmetsp:Transcript_17097/g.43162  ORF Transcript_17097/g.43162 Transcript_17097/m.43162 type:complete len:379 (-) Transcript_17097:534-1670(-)